MTRAGLQHVLFVLAGDSPLMKLVFENTSQATEEVELEHAEGNPRLWRFRKPINLASLTECLAQRRTGNKFGLLQLFIRKVNRK